MCHCAQKWMLQKEGSHGFVVVDDCNATLCTFRSEKHLLLSFNHPEVVPSA
jgi:hypothetical protein